MVGSKVISLPASVAQINGVLKDSNRIAHFVETLWGLVANATGKEPLVSILQLQTYMEEELLNVMPDMEDLIFDEMVLEYCL
jgi:tRNA A37 threonylcarbamoyladenosine synthetase subunit TsaC/SUA5/YrdC